MDKRSMQGLVKDLGVSWLPFCTIASAAVQPMLFVMTPNYG
jgi:hypothetical protein